MAQVLHRLGFDQSSVPKTLKAQTRLLLFNYWATYCILKARRPKFVPLEAPLPKDVPQAAAPMAPPPSAAPKLPEKPALSKQQGAAASPEKPDGSGALKDEAATGQAAGLAGVP